LRLRAHSKADGGEMSDGMSEDMSHPSGNARRGGDDGEGGRPKAPRSVSMPVGVVIERRPGVTRWQRWVYRPVAVLPGAGPADWRLLRSEGGIDTYHAATRTLELHRADVEAYKISLSMTPPSVFVVLRPDDAGTGGHPFKVHAVTASAYEAQDYQDSGDEIVEPVAMTPGLEAWVRGFADAHFVAEPFRKRRRGGKRPEPVEEGLGDPRIRQAADVYRAPVEIRRATLRKAPRRGDGGDQD
jgi:hypothetical protein